MKHLLVSAKVKFHGVHDSVGVSQCDLCLDRVKVIDLLVANSIQYIPSVQQLTQMDKLRYRRQAHNFL